MNPLCHAVFVWANFPELGANLVAALSSLDAHNLSVYRSMVACMEEAIKLNKIH
jgi:hypothetical protein